jgi:hypothetical protein
VYYACMYYICMRVCMYMHVCMYVCMCVCMYVLIIPDSPDVYTRFVCMYVRTYVRMGMLAQHFIWRCLFTHAQRERERERERDKRTRMYTHAQNTHACMDKSICTHTYAHVYHFLLHISTLLTLYMHEHTYMHTHTYIHAHARRTLDAQHRRA